MTIPNTSKHIFISYARIDGNEYASRLDDDLRAAGYLTWRDIRSLNEYQDFSAEIETNIQSASHIVVCVTPSIDANPSSFVRREIIYAESKGKPIIPLVFPDATVPTLINHLTWIPFFEKTTRKLDYDCGFDNLLIRLKSTQVHIERRVIDDPYNEYLKVLYDQIVRYLNLTVFSLLSLHSDASPASIESSAKNVLPMAFWTMAGVEDEINPIYQFNNFNEAFDKYDGRVLLLGDPGGGKTTTLFAFARDAIVRRLENSAFPLPVLVPITTWDSQTQPPLDVWLATIIPALKQNELANLIESGWILLLLDGLDELGGERLVDPHNSEGLTYDPRQRFMSNLPDNNQIIITCRTKDYVDIGQKVRLNGAVTLRSLNDVQMQDYLRELPDLWAALTSDDELRDVARTPLLLSLFTYAFRELPAEAKTLQNLNVRDVRDKIFETYVQRRYAHEERRVWIHHDRMPFTLNDVYEILGVVAADNLASWFALENVIQVADIELVFGNIDTVKFIEMVCNLNLLTYSVDGTLRFIHLLLRDYFTSHFASINIQNPDKSMRSKAAIVLGSLRNDRSIEILIQSLDDPESMVRSSSALSLGRLGEPRAIEPLTKLLSDSSRYFPLLTRRVCDVAARALARIGTPEALEAVRTWRKQ